MPRAGDVRLETAARPAAPPAATPAPACCSPCTTQIANTTPDDRHQRAARYFANMRASVQSSSVQSLTASLRQTCRSTAPERPSRRLVDPSCSTHRPSFIFAMRSAKSKTRLSCVTTITARSAPTRHLAHQLHHRRARVSCPAPRSARRTRAAAAREPAPGRWPPAAAARRTVARARVQPGRPARRGSSSSLRLRDRLRRGPPVDQQRHRGVLRGRQRRQQVELLEHEADVRRRGTAPSARRAIRGRSCPSTSALARVGSRMPGDRPRSASSSRSPTARPAASTRRPTHVQVDAAQCAVTSRRPGPVRLHDVPAMHGHVRRQVGRPPQSSLPFVCRARCTLIASALEHHRRLQHQHLPHADQRTPAADHQHRTAGERRAAASGM